MGILDDYYVQHNDYEKLKILAEKLRTPSMTSKELIDYVINNNIDVNSYITTFNLGIYTTIIFQIVQTTNYHDFYKFLIAKGADICKISDYDEESKFHFQHILFQCHEKYIKLLLSSCSSININLRCQVLKKLYSGNIRRLMLLLKFNVLTVKTLSEIFKSESNIYVEVINVLIDRINLICKTSNIKSEVDKTILKYIDILKFILKFKIDCNVIINDMSIIQYCANFYLYEIIEFFYFNGNIQKINEIVYHSKMDPKFVASLRQLLNDRRYVCTANILKLPIDYSML